MKWFECWGEWVEIIYQPIQARNAESAEKKFRKMYSGVLNVRVNAWPSLKEFDKS